MPPRFFEILKSVRSDVIRRALTDEQGVDRCDYRKNRNWNPSNAVANASMK
jgi:hypothetical protein